MPKQTPKSVHRTAKETPDHYIKSILKENVETSRKFSKDYDSINNSTENVNNNNDSINANNNESSKLSKFVKITSSSASNLNTSNINTSKSNRESLIATAKPALLRSEENFDFNSDYFKKAIREMSDAKRDLYSLVDDNPLVTPSDGMKSKTPTALNLDNLDNISFSSDDTIDLVSQARNYYLENDDEVENKRIFLTEARYHSSLSLSNASFSRSANSKTPVVASSETGYSSAVPSESEQNKNSIEGFLIVFALDLIFFCLILIFAFIEILLFFFKKRNLKILHAKAFTWSNAENKKLYQHRIFCVT